MKKLISDLRSVKNEGGEALYSLAELKEKLQSDPSRRVEVTEDMLLLPYYFDNDILELYWFELKIIFSTELDLEQRLLRMTGKRCIEDVPKEIVELQKECHTGTQEDGTVPAARLLRYIEYVMCHPDTKETVLKHWQAYHPEKLVFAVY